MNNSKSNINTVVHGHSPSEGYTLCWVVIDTIFHARRWCDNRSMTARCSKCGSLIRIPKPIRIYEEISLLVFGMLLSVIEHVLSRYLGENLFLKIVTCCIILYLPMGLVPRIWLGLSSWEVVPITTNEKQAVANEAERVAGNKGRIVLYTGISIFLYFVTDTILVRLFG